MELSKASNLYSLNKSTYVNLRWIAYIGQLTAIIIVQFLLKFDFNYIICISVIFFSVITNLILQFKIKENQLNNNFSKENLINLLNKENYEEAYKTVKFNLGYNSDDSRLWFIMGVICRLNIDFKNVSLKIFPTNPPFPFIANQKELE